jgi:hypothetical protein
MAFSIVPTLFHANSKIINEVVFWGSSAEAQLSTRKISCLEETKNLILVIENTAQQGIRASLSLDFLF